MQRPGFSFKRESWNSKRISVCCFYTKDFPVCQGYPVWMKTIEEKYPNIIVNFLEQKEDNKFCKLHNIRYFPTTMIFCNNKLVDKISGFNKEKLESAIEEHYYYAEKNYISWFLYRIMQKIKIFQLYVNLS